MKCIQFSLEYYIEVPIIIIIIIIIMIVNYCDMLYKTEISKDSPTTRVYKSH